MRKFNKKAFTLVELVIVIAVIAILSVVLIPQLTGVISDAKIAKDKSTASQMTLTLQTAFPEGLPEGVEATDVRNILNEMGTTYSFIPNSGNNCSYWYDISKNIVVFGTGSEIANNTVSAEKEPIILNSIEEIIPGYILLDLATSTLGKIVNSLRNLQSIVEYSAIENKIDTLTVSNTGLTEIQLEAAISHLKNNFKPSNTLFVNDFGYFTTSSTNHVKNVIFSDGITYLPEYFGDVKAVENGITLPNSLKFITRNTLLNNIEKIKEIDTTFKYFNENIITTGNQDIFSNYLLQRTPALSSLSANARDTAVAMVDFSAVINSNNVITNKDGSQKMPISIEANIPSYYNSDVCSSTEKCFVNNVDNTLLNKNEYNALSLEDKSNYEPRIIDRNKILAMRFKYQSLDTGYIKVNVMVLDNLGLLCEGETTYYPEVEINSLDFSNGSILFTNPKIPSFDAQDINYKIEILDENNEVKNDATFNFTAEDINTSNIMVGYSLGTNINNLDFMQQLVDQYQYIWYAQNGTVLSEVNPDTTCYIYKVVESSAVNGDTTTTTTTSSKIYINEQNKLYEEYYKTSFIVKEIKIGNTISVDIKEEHLAYQRKLTAVSLPANYLTSVLSEQGIRFNTIKAKVSVFKSDILLASKTAVFGTPDNPITTSYVREITDDTEQAIYFYTYNFKDPLYYVSTNTTEELAFTNKQIYSYEKLSNNSYTFKIKGTGEFDGEGIQLAVKTDKGILKVNYDAKYSVAYNIQPNYVAVSIKGLDSIYSLETVQNIPNSTAYTNRLTYVYASERELVNTEQSFILEQFNGRDVSPKAGTDNTYTFTLTAGEEFNPLNTIIKFADETKVNASAFVYTIQEVDGNKIISIMVGETMLIVECDVSEIYLTFEYANPGITSTISIAPKGCEQLTITNEQSGEQISCLFDQIITLEAHTPAEGYRFVGWFENGNLLSVLRNYTYVMGDSSTTLVAEYATDPANLLVFKTNSTTKTASLDWCYNKNITEVYIPSHYDSYKVTKIANEVFNNCVNLATIIVPSTVISIGADAFTNTQFLTNLSNEGAIYFGYYLYKYIEPKLNAPTTITIKEGITTIMDYAFQNCSSVETIILPSTLTTIGAYAFDCCDSLENIIIPNSVKTIGNYAFRECISLKIININKVETLGSYAFYNCVSLETFVMSENLKVLNNYTFSNCVMLTNITLHEGITKLGIGLFSNCSALVSIKIPSTVTSLNVSSVFSGCTALAEVILPEDNTYRQLGAYFFANCQVLINIENLNITNLILIGSNTFSGCSSFDFGDLVLGTGAQEEEISLSSSTFSNCYLLKSVTFASPLKGSTIHSSMFSGCMTLTQITFISAINTINDSAFSGCIALARINGINFKSINFIGNNAFYNCYNLDFGNNLVIGSMNAEKVSIGNQSFYNCDKLINVVINNENLYNAYSNPSYPIRNNALAPSAFYNCTALVSISLPINTTTIYYRAFRDCPALQYINKVYSEEFVLQKKISENLINFNSESLYGTTNYYNSSSAVTVTDNMLIKSNQLIGYLGTASVVTVPSTITAIGDNAFANNLYLTEIIIPSSVTIINANAFIGCLNLTTVIFESNSALTTINDNAFDNCEELVAIYFNKSTPATLGENVFTKTVTLYVPEINIEAYKTAWEEYGAQINQSNLPENPVSSDPEEPGTSIETEVVINGTILVSYIGEDETYTVPDNITTIGAYAFNNNKTLITITLPSSITTICEGAFNNCSNLEQVIFNSNITTLANKIFYNCSKLKILKNLNFSNITNIGNYAFYNCSALNIVNFKIYATNLGTNVFQNCRMLSTLIIVNDLVNNMLPALTFSGCSNLTIVGLPATITKIGDSAFSGCGLLTTITNLNTNALTEIGNYAFNGCLKYEFSNKALSLETLTSMGIGAFQNCKALTSLNIINASFPSNTIPANSFANCSGLTTINLPTTLTTLDSNSFNGCSGLTNFTFNNNLTTIGNGAFENCKNLISINLNKVSSLGAGAFRNCYVLESVIMPNTLTNLKANTFENCKVLTILNLQYITTFESFVLKGCEKLKTTTLSNNLTTLPANTFNGWIGLTTIKLPTSLTEIKDNVFSNCENLTNLDLSNVDPTKLGKYIMQGCTSLTNVILPNTLTTIPQNLFYGASSLETISSTSPNITTIGAYAFFNCQNLREIFIDFTKLTSIGNYAFYNCYNLDFGETLTLSNSSITQLSLGTYTFTNCKKLKNIVFASSKIKSLSYSESNKLSANTFQNCTELLTVTLPTTTVDHFYSSAFQNCIKLTTINNLDLSQVVHLDNYVFYNCQSLNFGDNIENPLQISNSTKALVTLNSSVFYNCKQLKSVEICARQLRYSNNSYLNYLYTSMFYGCINLEKVILPETNKVTKFNSNVFEYCINLRTIENLELNNVTVLDSNAFHNCFNLNFGEMVTLNANLTTFGTSVFNNCKQLKNITFNGTLKNNLIPNLTFYGCNNLETVTITSQVNKIGSSAFFECFKLKTFDANFSTITAIDSYAFKKCRLLNFEDGLTLGPLTTFGIEVFYNNDSLKNITLTALPNNTLPAYTFFNCYNLKNVNLPNNLTNINTYAFSGCSSLSEIVFPNTLATIGTYAFDGCVSLKEIVIPNSVVSIGSYAFRFCAELTDCTLSTNISYKIISSSLFYGCISLRTITIPANITEIGINAFNYCSSLTTVYMLNETPITAVNTTAFKNSYTQIIVPENSYSAYLGTSAWASFRNMLAKPSEFETINGFLIKGTTLIRYVGDAQEIVITDLQITLKREGAANEIINVNILNIGKFAFVELSTLTTLRIQNTITCSTNYHYNCENLIIVKKFN